MQASHDPRGKRVYADNVEEMLLCTEDFAVCDLKQKPQKAPFDLKLHNEACKSIYLMAELLHLNAKFLHVHTYINAFLLWYQCIEAITKKEHQQPEHRKHASTTYIDGMPLRKLTVLLPAVCLWVSVKCCDMQSLDIVAKTLASMMLLVHTSRGDIEEYTYKELFDTEHAVVDLLDCDFLANQEYIDSLQHNICAQFKYEDGNVKAHSEMLSIVFESFSQKIFA
jgi:hypothetical protein